MKRNLAFLLTFLMLVFSLTACGGGESQDSGASDSNQSSTGSQSEQQGTQNNSAVTGDTAQNNNNHSNGTNESTQNHPIQDGVNDVMDGMENAVDDMTGQNSGESGVSYDEMLNNGKLRTR